MAPSLLILLACSTTGASSPYRHAGAKEVAAFEKILVAVCIHEATCLHADPSIVQACRDHKGRFLMAGYSAMTLPEARGLGARFDMAQATKCADELLTASCLALRPRSCERVYRGGRVKKLPDEPCGALCDPSARQACGPKGKCLAPAKSGAACAGNPTFLDLAGGEPRVVSAPFCKPGLSCVQSKCQAPGKAGASCEEVSCGKGLYCLPDPDGGLNNDGGLCAAQASAGAPCGEDALHAPFAHGDQDALAKEAHEPQECADGLVCAGFHGTEKATWLGVCRPAAAVGAACEVPPPEQRGQLWVTGCAYGLNCVAGRCVLPPASGPCSEEGFPCELGNHRCDPQTHTCVPGLGSVE